ncbi:protein of unknown function [Serratia sp. Tan611]|nr:protein of unknown function [Serratia sp. Tan611]
MLINKRLPDVMTLRVSALLVGYWYSLFIPIDLRIPLPITQGSPQRRNISVAVPNWR